jgi:hypothetical protein
MIQAAEREAPRTPVLAAVGHQSLRPGDKKLGRRNAQSDKAAAEALAFAQRMRPILAEMGAPSANRAAAVLNERGVPTAADSKWSAVQVVRVPPSTMRASPRS